jgi:hypothetical protein
MKPRIRLASFIAILLAIVIGVVVAFFGSASATPPKPLPLGPIVKHVLITQHHKRGVVVGKKLKTTNGEWTNNPTSFTYQWRRCDSSGNNCVNIVGATSNVYTVVSVDVGHTIRAAVTAHNEAGETTQESLPSTLVTEVGGSIVHYEYVFEDAKISVYNMDESFKETENFTLSGIETSKGIRGVSVCATGANDGVLYISYGEDKGTSGKVTAWNLKTKKAIWTITGFGIDSGTINQTCTKLYEPVGELNSTPEWKIINTTEGKVEGKYEKAGLTGPHNTVLGQDGHTLLLGDRKDNGCKCIGIVNTNTNVVTETESMGSGIRPLSIDSTNKYAIAGISSYDGFKVANIQTGQKIFETSFGSCPQGSGKPTTCSHGVSISPNSKEVAVVDFTNQSVQFWDISKLPEAPTKIASVPIVLTGEETSCGYDCLKDGWAQHSLDGKYVFVGDAEKNVIETATHKNVANLAHLVNTRKMLEVDWEGGINSGTVVAASQRTGIGA